MGSVKLSESAVDGVLREGRESRCDLTDTCLYGEFGVVLLGVDQEVVKDDDAVGPVCLHEHAGLRVPVLDPYLSRHSDVAGAHRHLCT